MQQHTEQPIVGLVQDISNNSFHLQAHMIHLDVVQDAIAQLMERIDEIKYNGWSEDGVSARILLGEVERSVRLIDMAFNPLMKQMQSNADDLHSVVQQAFEFVVEENKKADAPTSTKEI